MIHIEDPEQSAVIIETAAEPRPQFLDQIGFHRAFGLDRIDDVLQLFILIPGGT